mmetsp:Transcript_860/g.1926  ORF Transcript_860/g.1926 Transcript_860/m.1926 type:complete len:252 (-) Transcript_860:205-960(-)
MSYAAKLNKPAAAGPSKGPEQVDNRQKLLTMSVQDQVAEKQQKSEMELLRDIRKNVVETDEVATRTLETLHGQTEQINRITQDAEAIEHNLDTSAHLLRGMKGNFGWLQNLFSRAPPPPPPKQQGATTSTARPTAGSNDKVGNASASSSSAPAMRPQDRLIAEDAARKKAEAQAEGHVDEKKIRPDQRNPEADKILDEIEAALGGIKAKAEETNRTLDHHNEVLPKLGQTMATSQDRMRNQHADLKKLNGR